MYTRNSIKQYRHSLSDREARLLSTFSYNGKTTFTTDDVCRLVPKARSILDNLVRKKWIINIRRGLYMIVPLEAGEEGAANYTIHGFALASYLVKPYYIGYGSALNYHGLTEQTPSSVYVATTRPKNSVTKLNVRFRFVTIPEYKIFGTQEVEIDRVQVLISSPEKTIVDCLDHPEHCGGVEEVAKALYFSQKELDTAKMIEFARKIGNGAVIKRLGYIAETLSLDNYADMISRIGIKSGYSIFDPTMPAKGHIKERWKLVVNSRIEPRKWMA